MAADHISGIHTHTYACIAYILATMHVQSRFNSTILEEMNFNECYLRIVIEGRLARKS